MRKKIRTIIIDGKDYVWLCGSYNCDGDGSSKVRIFKDKKLIIEELTVETVTPKVIEEKIRAFLA